MKIAVVYKSKKSNKKLALAIGKAISVEPQELAQFDSSKEYDVVFFGAGIYGGSVAPDVLTQLETWKNDTIKKVILYSASGHGVNQYQSVIELFNKNGITVDDKVFTCTGQAFFFISHGHPNQQDLDAVSKFAVEMLGK